MSLKDSYKMFDQATTEAMTWLMHELAGIRSGRVTPGMIESLAVEHYGTRTPLNGLASITNSDARTLLISPWDTSATAAIEKAVLTAQLGAQPAVDGKVIRLAFPSLSEEMRGETIKQVHRLAEEGRVRLRQARDEALSIIKKNRTDGDVTEDDFYDGKKELDDKIDTANQEIEKLVAKKEADIKTI